MISCRRDELLQDPPLALVRCGHIAIPDGPGEFHTHGMRHLHVQVPSLNGEGIMPKFDSTGNILGEATKPLGNNLREAMRHS